MLLLIIIIIRSRMPFFPVEEKRHSNILDESEKEKRKPSLMVIDDCKSCVIF